MANPNQIWRGGRMRQWWLMQRWQAGATVSRLARENSLSTRSVIMRIALGAGLVCGALAITVLTIVHWFGLC